MQHRHTLLTWIAVFLGACTAQDQQVRVLKVWHFWSEPAQERAFRAAIAEFERAHPTIRVELTPLQWSDGQAKLQIAFSSGAGPDVVHLGAEWIAQFAPVLTPLDTTLSAAVRPEFVQIGMVNATRYAIPWTVNARVLFVHRATGISEGASWQEMYQRLATFHQPPQRYGIGLCTSDPHNVIKRDLPFLWSAGARLLHVLPYSAAAADSNVVGALQALQQLTLIAVVEPSRQLDIRLRRGELGAVLSGLWMLADSAVVHHYTVLPAIPSMKGGDGASILSADCFAISKNSPNRREAYALLAYLAQWDVTARFCRSIADAGFPAQHPPTPTALDSLLRQSWLWRAAYEQTLRSRILPVTSTYLEAERAVEEVLSQLLYRALTPSQAQQQLLTRLTALDQAKTVYSN
ncbi:MAG: extracellular solute-binding protein [Chlorobi bacterium]|nr:extracellular solute-binding protein [Chlorobiota bacterium]